MKYMHWINQHLLICLLKVAALVPLSGTPIDLSVGTAAQSSTLNNFVASLAIDGVSNFTHTIRTDDDPTWQVLLPQDHVFGEITLVNRSTGAQRLRDITVQVLDFSGNVNSDFDGGTVVFSSELLNPNNELNSPSQLVVDAGGVVGNMIRVIRTPESPQDNDARALSLNEVLAEEPPQIVSFAPSAPAITPGDPFELIWEIGSSVSAVTIDNGVGDVFSATVNGEGSVTIDPGPLTTTSYEMTTMGLSGSATATIQLLVVDEPLIYSFTADTIFSQPGATVQLDWSVGGNATVLTLDGSDVSGTTGMTVAPLEDTVYQLEASNANGVVTRTVVVRVIEDGVPIISEFLASNNNGLTDEEGNSSDWIEIYNPSSVPASLAGYYLTDDATVLTQWQFPDVTIGPGEYLIVFASGEDRVDPAGTLHTNFSLSSNGEYLALVRSELSGLTVVDEFAPSFPEQEEDISYGLDWSSNEIGFFLTPTPGAMNGSIVIGFVEDTGFSFDRGFYVDPVQVEISTQTTGAQIRYTLDGSTPTALTGLVYVAGTPITISQTTVLRAAAFKDNFAPTNVDTHTYIFKADVIASPVMDTGITQDPTYAPLMDAALSAIPTVSLTFANDLGRDEQETSIEFINFEDGDTQVDAGIERFGGLVTNFPKRSARINFRRIYGPGRLNFDLFENHDWPSFQPAERYDAIELRAGNHDMAQRGAYLSNRYADDALLDMGQIAPHGRFVHVYINGVYWGQYHLRERWNDSMASEYFGGEAEDYEAVDANDGFIEDLEVYDGPGDFWAETESLAAGPNPFTNARSHVDIIDHIDFMLLYVNGRCESEFRAFGSRSQQVPFKFYLKDADGYLRSPTHDVLDDGPLDLVRELQDEGNPEYRILLADRIHKHFFNDGALTGSQGILRLQDRVTETQLSIIAECARWGFRTPQSWTDFQNNLISNQLPGQVQTLIDRFRMAEMYPDQEAPFYSQHGGVVTGSGPTISISDGSLQIYFLFGARDTDDDPYRNSLDPRLPGGGINPAATVLTFDGSGSIPTTFVQSGDAWSFLDDGSNQGTAWRGAGFVESSAWQSGPSQLGYGDGDEATVVGFVDVDPGEPGVQRNVTTYFRKSDVDIPDPSLFEDFTMTFIYDDAIAIYVNGVEVARENLSANALYDEFSNSVVVNNAFGTVQIPSSLFVSGNNTIAAEVHQRSFTSSDLSFSLSLTGNLPGGVGNSNVSEPISINTSGWLLSRTYNPSTGEWSALNEAFFAPDPVAASAANLVVSEINYNPNDPETAAELAIATDADEFEFIEIKNVSLLPVDLSGVRFSDGVDFTFGNNNVLGAGERLVLVRNISAFEERYASQVAGVIYGVDSIGQSEYSGGLSNGGEQIVLEDAQGGIIHDFTYDDDSPWPTAPDGPGFSLALINPFLPVPDHSIPTNWAASAILGGTPGLPGGVGFAGDPNADQDGDGINALLEYALGSSDFVRGDGTLSIGFDFYEVGGQVDEYLTISYVRNEHTQNALSVIPRIGEDLVSWSGVPELVLVSETDNSDGTVSVVYRSAVPVGQRPSGREFIQILVE